MTFNQDLEQWLVSEQRHFHQASNNAKARRPHVTLTYAQSWDGSIASDPGTPMALSGDESLRMTHQLRSLHDGILVGIGTVLADDPRLNVRKWSGRDPQPIVLDSHLRMPPSSRLCQRGDHCCWVLTTVASADNRHDCEPIVVPGDEEGHVNLHEALQLLYQRGINTLMVEGGASVITAFLREGLADALCSPWHPFLSVATMPLVRRKRAIGDCRASWRCIATSWMMSWLSGVTWITPIK